MSNLDNTQNNNSSKPENLSLEERIALKEKMEKQIERMVRKISVGAKLKEESSKTISVEEFLKAQSKLTKSPSEEEKK